MLAAFSITPLGAGESVGGLVAEAVRVVRQSGLTNETNAMFTNLEGEWDRGMAPARPTARRVHVSRPVPTGTPIDRECGKDANHRRRWPAREPSDGHARPAGATAALAAERPP